MERVRDAGAGFRSITEAVDTTTSAGRMVMQMLGSSASSAFCGELENAEFER
jgi:DNA invertase Pin-like site-specific DNA recombinase